MTDGSIGDRLGAPGQFSNAAFGPGGSRWLLIPAVSAEEELVRITDGYTYERLEARTLETMRMKLSSFDRGGERLA